MKIRINEISDIRFGLYTQSGSDWEVPYLQVRQFDEEGLLQLQTDEYVKRDQKSETHLLKDGDVLFVGKGNRLFAWCYRDVMGPMIASSVFFIIRPNQSQIYPEYLSAILNAPQTKAVFHQIGGGTNIFSIRKSELGAFELPLLSLEKQIKIAELAVLFRKEIALTKRLLDQKQYLYKGVISKLLKY